jgi:uracil-DNA glycosylase
MLTRQSTAAATVHPTLAPRYLPLPHPSPRNQPWFQHHAWFEQQLVPVLRARINALAER